MAPGASQNGAATVRDGDAERPTKRAKTSPEEVDSSKTSPDGVDATSGPNGIDSPAEPIVRPSLLDRASVAELKASYEAAGPYPHVVLPSPFDPALLAEVKREFSDNVHATYKETDLFKMLQTGDLANIDALDPEAAAKLPTARKLRDALYSKEFRAFVSEVTGCGGLSDKTDCACNIHVKGGHLLCHDDVIGTRAVSYIIYLVDESWSDADGGALELYPPAADSPHEPAVSPTLTVLPKWNTMAMFAVQPGRSFHSIQEVRAGDKPRMSIQGWFHRAEPPAHPEWATRNQLQARGNEGDEGLAPFGGRRADDLEGDLDVEDLKYLQLFVDRTYLKERNCVQVAEKFGQDGSVQLRSFLNKEWAGKLAEATRQADADAGLGNGKAPGYEAGVGDGWRAIGPAHKQRYLRWGGGSGQQAADGDTPAASQAGALLGRLQADLFSSAPFARLLLNLTGIALRSQRTESRRFRPGLDYTVAHGGVLTSEPRLDAVLSFVDDASEASAEAWESGDVGGFEAYVASDESGEAAEYQRADDDGGVLNVTAAGNTLSLVMRGEGLMRFVRYVSAAAPSSRWDLSAVYEPVIEE
ncbi:Oxoglutarate and iron-dependent oxygenase degradation C-term-domain-containing protein [Hyaloraphidium curvatum]|nr:Oxoglutarate and iron-dependent oxygenase degradation C-term-domain-containing protein [Hyaloraphidium curvatum]